MDESYQDNKNLANVYISKSSTPLMVSSTYNYPQSHHSVLNAFRADFEDFSHFQDNSLDLSNLYTTNSTKTSGANLFSLKSKNLKFDNASTSNVGAALEDVQGGNYETNPSQLNWSRFSNPIALRRSAKSSIVTYQAFQKVFKMRYEEGRAHVRLTDFADSATTQPYTTEQRVKYERMLGKNKLRHYNTIYNSNHLLPVFNNVAGLFNSMNFYFYEFPFLDGLTNDPTRHVWFDAFIKFAQKEVGGSSVSKYSIVGVPFYKKKFDFNVKQGQQLGDSELYFSRIATSRKNYLPQ